MRDSVFDIKKVAKAEPKAPVRKAVGRNHKRKRRDKNDKETSGLQM